MHKTVSHAPSSSALSTYAAAIAVMTGLMLAPLTAAHAQQQNETPALIQDELGKDEAPKEFPYPGAKEEGFEQKQDSSQQPLVHERPVRIDDDGNYIYDTSKPTPPPRTGQQGTERPKEILDSGEYRYDTTPKKPQFKNTHGTEAPIEITNAGDYHYQTEKPKVKGSAGLRFGVMTAPNLENKDTGISFKQMYTSGLVPMAFFDRGWKLSSKVGYFGLKFTTGVVTASGPGNFKTQDVRRRADDQPLERFNFLLFPNQLTAVYRFQYSETQFFVPFVEGGMGYYTFAELRSDNTTPKIGGTPTVNAAGGLNLLLDNLDPRSMRKLESEYEIGHVWLTLEFRQTVSLNSDFDFTSSAITAGFMVEF